VLDRIGEHPKTFVLDCRAVPFLDLTGAHSLKAMTDRFHKSGTEVVFKNVNAQVVASLHRFGVLEHGARIEG
jgi:SulP family sulfate permease